MDVFLTIDVETYGGNYEADVFAGGLGLPFILQACKAREFPATFFVEALGATQWGLDPLRRVCDAIREAGQEIQLHLHPTVARLDGFTPGDDAMWHYDQATQTRLIQTGLDQLSACGVPPITAFRAGDLGANADTLSAMETAGLWISSNRDLDTKSSIRSRLNTHFPIENDLSRLGRMLDLPVTSFKSPIPALDGTYRHFQITALSTMEMRSALIDMEKAGYSAATILTHPGEYFLRRKGSAIPKRKNCHRLLHLLDAVRASPSMQPRHVSNVAAMKVPNSSPPAISLQAGHAVVRMAMQVLARLVPGL